MDFPGFGRVLYIAEPRLIKEVFAGDSDLYLAGAASRTVLEPALGPNSVLTLDGAAHMRQRRLLLGPFHGQRIDTYEELIAEITENSIADWPLGRVFALRAKTQDITLEVILRAVFGVTEPGRRDRAHRLIGRFASRAHLVTLLPAIRRNLGPLSPWVRFTRSRRDLDAFIYEEIAMRRRRHRPGGGSDVLSLLLDARHQDGSPMSDAELRDELVTVLAAGHETTATALAWGLERLLRTPAVLARLKASLARGDDEYLDATVKEILRIRPVITDVARRLSADTTIGGYSVAAGTLVMPAIAVVHQRPDLFDRPTVFRPERFLDDEIAPYSWIPFGGGIRRCVGAAFAQMEMKVILRTILAQAALRPIGRDEAARIRHITVAPARGGRVLLERRLRPLPASS